MIISEISSSVLQSWCHMIVTKMISIFEIKLKLKSSLKSSIFGDFGSIFGPNLDQKMMKKGYFKNFHFSSLSLCPLFFINFLFFHQMMALPKLWKMFFVSSKKLFPFSRYSNFCIFPTSFSVFPDWKGQIDVE